MREIAFGAIAGLIMALTAFLAAAWPVPGRPVAAYFPPGLPAEQVILAIAHAGGHLLDIANGSTLAISSGDDPGYASKLYKSGAWFVVDASLASLCTGRPWRADS